MNILKKLGGLLWGNGRQDLVQIRGALYQDDVTGQRKLLFPQGLALITRSATPHVSSLIISQDDQERVQQQQEEEEEEEVPEMHFFIAREMGLLSTEEGYAWRDSEGRRFIFSPEDDVSSATRQLFLTTLLQAMYEWEHKQSPEDVDDHILLSYLATSPPPSSSTTAAPTTPSKSAQSATSPPRTPASPPPTSTILGMKGEPAFSAAPSLDDVTSVLAVDAQLFWFDPAQGVYQLCAHHAAVEILQKDSSRIYFFHVRDPETKKTYTFQPLTSDMNPVLYHPNNPLTMTYGTSDHVGKVFCWGINVPDTEEKRSLVKTFGRCITEAQRDEAFNKMKEDEQRFLLSSFAPEDEEMEDAPGAVSSDEESEAEEDEEYNYSQSSNKEKNSHLAISYNHDKSFVVRGSQIGVFKITPDSLEYATNIKDIKTPQGVPFSPSKTMLHTQDSAMLLMNPHNENSLYKMDLTYGKVVEEWKIDDHTNLKAFCPESKYAQKTVNQTLVGMSQNSIFLIDPRLSGNKRVEAMTKQYARETRNDFSSTATTEKGDLVVVSNKGDVRLFNHIAKNAKTHLPGFGDPILGVDVTADGKWVLATCKSYLIIICTELKDSGSTGFAKPMGQKKPVPKKLQLRSEHIAAMGSPPSFTAARFNVGENEETTIVTSTGPYVVTWNFRRIKLGHLYDYKIKKYPDLVVADNFRFGQHKSIVVALPDDVTMVQKSKLAKPQQASDLKSQIVNSPF